jgi:hypothetical protein
LGFGSARPFRESCRDRVVAALMGTQSVAAGQRPAYRQSSDERHATRVLQVRQRVTTLRLQSSDRRKVEPKLSTEGLSLSLESLHDVCAKAKLSHFQPFVAHSVTYKPGRLMSVA